MSAASIIQKKHYTFQAYLKLEEQEHIRYEYYDGEVFAVAGASLNHGDIVSNGLTRSGLRDKGCRSFQESYKLELLEDKYYVYPDVVLTCHPEDIKADYIIKYPVLIAEVISPSTERYDPTVKWSRYRRLPSLKHFLFVSQEQPFIELYSRPDPTALFSYQAFDRLDDIIHFSKLDFKLTLQDVYASIVFPIDEDFELQKQL